MTSELIDNFIISVEGTKRGLDKLESIINTENLRHGRILSDNHFD